MVFVTYWPAVKSFIRLHVGRANLYLIHPTAILKSINAVMWSENANASSTYTHGCYFLCNEIPNPNKLVNQQPSSAMNLNPLIPCNGIFHVRHGMLVPELHTPTNFIIRTHDAKLLAHPNFSRLISSLNCLESMHGTCVWLNCRRRGSARLASYGSWKHIKVWSNVFLVDEWQPYQPLVPYAISASCMPIKRRRCIWKL